MLRCSLRIEMDKDQALILQEKPSGYVWRGVVDDNALGHATSQLKSVVEEFCHLPCNSRFDVESAVERGQSRVEGELRCTPTS